MPLTPAQNTGCNTGIITSVIILVVVGGVVSFFISGGEADFLPGFIVPFIVLFVVVPIVARAVKNARRTAQGGGSSTASQPASSPPSSAGSHRPYRYSLETGERLPESETPDQTQMMDEEEHRRAVSKIMSRRKRDMKTDVKRTETPVEAEFQLEDEEQMAREREQSRERKRKLTDIAESIRERNRQLQTGSTGDLPPGYAMCVSCGNITKLKGKRTRCPACGSIIEAV